MGSHSNALAGRCHALAGGRQNRLLSHD